MAKDAQIGWAEECGNSTPVAEDGQKRIVGELDHSSPSVAEDVQEGRVTDGSGAPSSSGKAAGAALSAAEEEAGRCWSAKVLLVSGINPRWGMSHGS